MQYFWLDCEYIYINFPNPYFTVAGCFCQTLQNKNCLYWRYNCIWTKDLSKNVVPSRRFGITGLIPGRRATGQKWH